MKAALVGLLKTICVFVVSAVLCWYLIDEHTFNWEHVIATVVGILACDHYANKYENK